MSNTALNRTEAYRIPRNIVWHEGLITKLERWTLNGHRSALVWITGLSASGKSTIAVGLERLLHMKRVRSYILDGDNVRHGLNSNLGFSEEDRKENLRRVGEIAKLFVDAGILTIASFISPYEQDRDMIRSLFPADEFIEVYLDCDISVCEARDPKGFYEKARKGDIKNFTGISAPYEIPTRPEVIVNTAKMGVEACVEKIFSFIRAAEIC